MFVKVSYFFLPLAPLAVSASAPGLGFLAPYLERLRRRPSTPSASKRSANDMITDTRQILYPPTTHENNRVLLKIVTFARNVGDHLIAIRQAHLGDFSQGRVWLFRRARHHLRANAATKRAVGQRRRFRFDGNLFTAFADELVDGWHVKIVGSETAFPGGIRGLKTPLERAVLQTHRERGARTLGEFARRASAFPVIPHFPFSPG